MKARIAEELIAAAEAETFMAFASIHVPNFPVQAVVRAEPSLRNQAVALVDGTPPIWNVVAANEAALLAGIELGMSKSQAAQFHAVEIRNRSRVQEKSAHAALLDLGASVSPRMEDTAPDTIILDISGLTSLFGSDENISAQLVQRASSSGFARACCSFFQSGSCSSRRARFFRHYCDSSRVKKRNAWANCPYARFCPLLKFWKLWSAGACATVPLWRRFPCCNCRNGWDRKEFAFTSWRAARVVRSLVLAQPGVCFEEEMALDFAIAELEPLSFLLGRLLDQLCARLEARALAACAIRTHFDLEDSFEKDFQVLSENSPPKLAPKTYEKVLSLPVPTRNSKMLLKLLASAIAGRSSARSHSKNYSLCRAGSSARGARRTISSQLSGSGKIRADHRTIGETGGPYERWLARIDRHASSRRFSNGRFRAGERRIEDPAKEWTATAHASGETPLTAFRVFRPEIQVKC